MDKPVKSAREAVAKAVYRILIDKAYTEITLDSIFGETNFSQKDISLITGVVNETVKMKKALDFVIESHSHITVPKLDKILLSVLRAGACQILYFDKLPSYAVVDESVKIVKRYKKHVAGYANAVLRGISGHGKDISFPDRYIGMSYEEWMAKRWEDAYGQEFALSFMQASNANPGTSVRVNLIRTSFDEAIQSLEKNGYKVSKSYRETGVAVLEKAPGIISSDLYKSGSIVFQDEAAARVCFFLNPAKNDRVLDMCAAPGGKTFLMAQIMNNKQQITACDISKEKIEAMRAEAARLGVSNVSFNIIDSTVFDAVFDNSFDKILADVPCSGTGIIRKKPEIKWNRVQKDILELSRIQTAILNNAFKYLKVGGELVYSTCSIEIEENEDIIREFMKNEKNASIVRYDSENEFMKLYPNIDGTDGFFAAKIRKRGRL